MEIIRETNYFSDLNSPNIYYRLTFGYDSISKNFILEKDIYIHLKQNKHVIIMIK